MRWISVVMFFLIQPYFVFALQETIDPFCRLDKGETLVNAFYTGQGRAVAIITNQAGQLFIHTGNKKTGPYPVTTVVEPLRNSGFYGYAVGNGREWRVYLNNLTEYGPFPYGRLVIYNELFHTQLGAGLPGRVQVIHNDKLIGAYDLISGVTTGMKNDGLFAFQAENTNGFYLHINGKDYGPYLNIVETHFSTTKELFAIVRKKDGRYFRITADGGEKPVQEMKNDVGCLDPAHYSSFGNGHGDDAENYEGLIVVGQQEYQIKPFSMSYKQDTVQADDLDKFSGGFLSAGYVFGTNFIRFAFTNSIAYTKADIRIVNSDWKSFSMILTGLDGLLTLYNGGRYFGPYKNITENGAVELPGFFGFTALDKGGKYTFITDGVDYGPFQGKPILVTGNECWGLEFFTGKAREIQLFQKNKSVNYSESMGLIFENQAFRFIRKMDDGGVFIYKIAP